jgi:hypothetical protein
MVYGKRRQVSGQPDGRSSSEEAEIVRRLRRKSHASFVASKTGFSFATVWRVAEAAGIELTDGKRAKGYKRLSPKKRAAVKSQRRGHIRKPKPKLHSLTRHVIHKRRPQPFDD